ncbi:tetratricopeptide repeat protein [Asanoa sp. NPDC049573]|uniref:tetratricopeptide repeat protein n=1 Tax=Asanoa sp. NPDC049573 TaxID=3155396 RepID=UPI00341490F1
MSIGLGDLTTRAQDRIHAGDLAGAEELLGAALATADPSPATATDELALAAALQGKVLLALGEAHAARGWASYAYSATTRLYGAHDPRTTDTATTLAAVLHRVGAHERAARLYHDVILELSAAEGPESARVLAAHADLATVEYARGDCATARTRLEDAWELHREVYGDGHPAGIRMLAKLGAMERDCGRTADSHAHFALAQELGRTHLPADHPLLAQVAALSRAAANPDHVCAVEDSVRLASDSGPPPPRAPSAPAGYARPFSPVPEHVAPVDPEPVAPPPVAPVPVAPPPVAPRPVTPTLRDGFDSGSALDDGPGTPRHAAADHPPDLFAPGADLRDAYATEVYPPEAEQPEEGWSPPAQRTAPERPLWPADEAPAWSDRESRDTWRTPDPEQQAAWATAATGWESAIAEPAHTGDAAWDRPAERTAPEFEPEPGPAAADERWRRGSDATWDRTTSESWEGDEWADEAWSGRAGDDERWAAPGTEPSDEGWERDAWGTEPPAAALPGGAEVAPPPAAYPREIESGAGPERRVAPLPVPYTPPRRKRRVAPLVIAGLLVVVLGAAAVIAGFMLIDPGTPVARRTTTPTAGPSLTPPPTSSAPLTPPAVRPGTPPGRVSLDDGTEQVTLRWTYPAGAGGPVVVSAGPTGQRPRPIEELPAGTDNYVVYGLGTTGDYCFVVGVVYSGGVVGNAKPVCTDRG